MECATRTNHLFDIRRAVPEDRRPRVCVRQFVAFTLRDMRECGE